MWEYKRAVIGIDNGTSGTIGCILVEDDNSTVNVLTLTPTKTEQNYTKKANNIKRLNYDAFLKLLMECKKRTRNIMIYMERPFTGTFTNTAILAARCFEAQLIAIEYAEIPYRIIDSKEWQKDMLPKGIKGSAALKKASADIGTRLLPSEAALIKKHGDADGFLIALWGTKQVM